MQGLTLSEQTDVIESKNPGLLNDLLSIFLEISDLSDHPKNWDIPEDELIFRMAKEANDGIKLIKQAMK